MKANWRDAPAALSLLLCVGAATAIPLEVRSADGRAGPTLAGVWIPQVMWVKAGTGTGSTPVWSADRYAAGFYDGRLTVWWVAAVPCSNEDHGSAFWESAARCVGPGLGVPLTATLAVAAGVWPAWRVVTAYRRGQRIREAPALPNARGRRLTKLDWLALVSLLAFIAAIVAVPLERNALASGSGCHMLTWTRHRSMVGIKGGRRTTYSQAIEQCAVGFWNGLLTLYVIRLDAFFYPSEHSALWQPAVLFPCGALKPMLTASLAVVLAVLPAVRVRSWRRWWRQPQTGCCAGCSYDLRATPVRCPECGLAVRQAPNRR